MHRAGLLAAVGLLFATTAANAGEVAGRITLAVEGAKFAQLGPVVVYLEALGDQATPPPGRRAEVRQHAVRFSPDFLVVAVGQRIEMPNDDEIFHNVFSMSAPNDFDLGSYPAGQSKSIAFDHPGLVRIYCSIHDGMRGGIFVAPSRLFDTASAKGYYRISDVPAGRYRMTVWNERLASVTREVSVPDSGEKWVDAALRGTPP